VFTDTVAVPASVGSPYILKVENGEPGGSHRVSSATIKVNGLQVAGPSDFDQHVSGFARSVSLTPQTTLEVRLTSSPGSYLTISLCGQKRDTAPPTIRVDEPPNGSSLGASSTPFIRVSYQDETALDLASLRITINEIDRTALFAKGPSEATATVDRNTVLKAGVNQVQARIRDVAGHEATDTSSFTLDLVAPTLVIAQPADGARVGSGDVDVIVQYSDYQQLDLATFAARLDGQPLPLAKEPHQATGRVHLASGPHTLEADIRDKAGNPANASSHFRVDANAPSLVIVQPVPGSTIKTGTPTVVIHYSDDEGVDTQTLKVVINGTDRTSAFAIGADEARWVIPPFPALPRERQHDPGGDPGPDPNTTPTRGFHGGHGAAHRDRRVSGAATETPLLRG
jgi:hypothetical protein